jgi:hypothetical protein
MQGDALNWTMNHFTISEFESDVPRLLHKAAAEIASLGDIEIFDITFCGHFDGPKYETKMTVYFSPSSDSSTLPES